MADYAVPIVELHERSGNLYKLNSKELEKILCHKDVAGKKVFLISIAGAFRKGKSFLLNFFVTYLEWLTNGEKGNWFDARTVLDKFHFRGGSERDTNGIFLWSKPYIVQNQDGEEVVVLLMDTQGTFDHKSTVQDCATIFALSTLVSSLQIFNVSAQIQEDDLNNLRFFTEYARLVEDENSCGQAPFQRLLFLVRDWPNSGDHDYGYEGGKDYLNTVLKIEPKQQKELQSLRKKIKSSFNSLLCFLMPHPGLRFAQGNHSEKVLGKVETDFQDQLAIFVPSLFGKGGKKMELKAIDGHELTCLELLQLIKAYMQIFNSDHLPEPKSILDATAEAVNIAAEQRAKVAYDGSMREKMSKNPHLADFAVLSGFQRQAEAAALAVFTARPKLGDQDSVKKHIAEMDEYFETRHMEFKTMVTQNVSIAEEKRRLLAEQEKERQRIKAEEERLRKEKELHQKNQQEQEELLRRQEERLRNEKKLQQKKHQEQEELLRRQNEKLESEKKEQKEKMRKQKAEQERRERELEEKTRHAREEQERRRREDDDRIRREREEFRQQQMQAQASSSGPSLGEVLTVGLGAYGVLTGMKVLIPDNVAAGIVTNVSEAVTGKRTYVQKPTIDEIINNICNKK